MPVFIPPISNRPELAAVCGITIDAPREFPRLTYDGQAIISSLVPSYIAISAQDAASYPRRVFADAADAVVQFVTRSDARIQRVANDRRYSEEGRLAERRLVLRDFLSAAEIHLERIATAASMLHGELVNLGQIPELPSGDAAGATIDGEYRAAFLAKYPEMRLEHLFAMNRDTPNSRMVLACAREPELVDLTAEEGRGLRYAFGVRNNSRDFGACWIDAEALDMARMLLYRTFGVVAASAQIEPSKAASIGKLFLLESLLAPIAELVEAGIGSLGGSPTALKDELRAKAEEEARIAREAERARIRELSGAFAAALKGVA